MNELTAGDFAAALRRLALLAEGVTPESLVRALTEEWTMKRRATRSVQGFRPPSPQGGLRAALTANASTPSPPGSVLKPCLGGNGFDPGGER